MIYSLYKTLQIDAYYSVNSIIYSLKNNIIFKNIIGDNAYKSKVIKRIVGILGSILSFSRALLFKLIYFFVVAEICKKAFGNNFINSFYHVYFFLTILGLFINNKLLTTSKKKYFSIILFQMDGNKFLRANFVWNIITLIVFNSISLLIIGAYYNIALDALIILLLLSIGCRIAGEALNIMFFRIYRYVWYSNMKLYYPIFLVLFACCFLPFIGYVISPNIITFISICLLIISIFGIIYIFRIDDFKLIYKTLNQMSDVMNTKEENSYYRQSLVNMKDKDKIINDKLIENKSGYDLFNTIFFERHKEILFRSARNISVIIFAIYIAFIVMLNNNMVTEEAVSDFLLLKLSWFVLIMYFINRGAVVTQAMFFNCDHAMLTYNFYREPDTIIGLFKRRLLNVIRVNLIPAFVIGIGNCLLLYITNTNSNLIVYLTSFLFIICLSIFFSVHYLVIYYLLQPYNKNMQIKKVSYSIVSFLTYFISFEMSHLIFNSLLLSILGIVFVILYIVIALLLVRRIAPRTFRLY